MWSILCGGGDELLCLARAGKTVHEIYFSTNNLDQFEDEEVWKELEKMEIDTIRISKTAFSKASYRSENYGMIGVVSSWNLGLGQRMIDESRPLVVLDQIEKPGNLGAILRTVEAFGGAGVILSDPEVDFFNPNVVRSSRGLMGVVPVSQGGKEEVLDWLKNSGRKVLATSSKAKKELGNETLPSSCAIVFGSEKKGLGKFWGNSVAEWIKVPMKGSASSLNLNVSVACLLYEYLRT